MAGTTEGQRRRWRGGRPWPDKCEGPGEYQHAKGCHPRRPKCRWRRRDHHIQRPCNCAQIPYPHRISSIDRRFGACLHRVDHVRVTWEILSGTDFLTGAPLR